MAIIEIIASAKLSKGSLKRTVINLFEYLRGLGYSEVSLSLYRWVYDELDKYMSKNNKIAYSSDIGKSFAIRLSYNRHKSVEALILGGFAPIYAYSFLENEVKNIGCKGGCESLIWHLPPHQVWRLSARGVPYGAPFSILVTKK